MSNGFDLNGNIYNYLKQNNMETDASKVIDSTNSIAEGLYSEGSDETTIFKIDENTKLNFEDFSDGFRKNSEFDDISDEQLQLLYDLLNVDGSGELTYDELAGLSEKGNKITNMSMWYKIAFKASEDKISDYSTDNSKKTSTINLKESFEKDEASKIAYNDVFGDGAADKVADGDVEVELQDLSDEKVAELAQKINNGEIDLAKYKPYLTKESYELLEASVNELKNNGSNNTTNGTNGTNNPPTSTGAQSTENEKPKNDGSLIGLIDTFKDKGNNPKEVATWLLQNGAITQEQYDEIQKGYETYTTEQQNQIDALIKLGHSEEEAIKILNITPESSFETNFAPETKSPEVIQGLVNQLFDSMDGWGTDDEQFDAIMNNPNLTSADLVEIIALYNDQKGSFVQDVDGDFSGGKQDQIMAKISAALVEEAKNGNPKAIDMLVTEFYNGTAGMTGTADEFIAGIFENADNKVLVQISNEFFKKYGVDITQVIKKDFSFGTEDYYIKRMNEALLEG